MSVIPVKFRKLTKSKNYVPQKLHGNYVSAYIYIYVTVYIGGPVVEMQRDTHNCVILTSNDIQRNYVCTVPVDL